MSRNVKIAIIAGVIAAAAIAGVVAAAVAPAAPAQHGNSTSETGGNGKKITIDLNENLGLKENPPK